MPTWDDSELDRQASRERCLRMLEKCATGQGGSPDADAAADARDAEERADMRARAIAARVLGVEEAEIRPYPPESGSADPRTADAPGGQPCGPATAPYPGCGVDPAPGLAHPEADDPHEGVGVVVASAVALLVTLGAWLGLLYAVTGGPIRVP